MRGNRYRRAGAMLSAFAAIAVISCSSETTEPPETEAEISIALANAALEIIQGGTVNVPVNLTRTDFTGAVTLSAEGLPTGVTTTGGTIAAGATSGTLTLTATPGATPTTGNVTIRASGSGVDSKTATLALTVRVRGTYSLAAAPAVLSIVQGTNASTSIAITRNDNFAGDVALTASSPTTGITASLTPSTLSGATTSATLNVTVAASVPTGNHTVNVTGTTAGLSNVTIPVNISVSAPGAFTMTAAPAALTLSAGQSANSTITINRTGGFAGNVALTATAPAGITVTMTPASTTGNTASASVTVGGTVAPGAYTITIRGNAAGVAEQTATIALTVPAAAGFTMAVSPTTLNLQQGAAGTSNVTLTRTGGFAGAVALTADAPAGFTVAFAPQSITDLTSAITITAGASVAPGNHTITIRANATGMPERTATITVTVTAAPGGFTIAAAPTALSVAAGANGTSTITVTRTGSFTGTVNLTATTPAGVTATFAPAAVTGNTSTLTLAVGAGVAAGPLTVTVRGNATGISEQTATINLTVTAPPAGGNVTYTFCGASGIPVAAFAQNGTGGWTAVSAGANNTYSFTITSFGGFAYVVPGDGGGFDTQIFFGTAAELIAQGQMLCSGTTGAGKTITGTVSGITAPFDLGFVTLGQATATLTGGATSFTLNGVLDGPVDLVGARSAGAVSGTGLSYTPSRFIIQRSLNLANNASVGVINFATDGAAPATATLTLANSMGHFTGLTAQYWTPRNTLATLYTTTPTTAASSMPWYGFPGSLRQAGELHVINAVALSGLGFPSRTRQAMLVQGEVENETLTFGPALSDPVRTTVATSPYLRMRIAHTPQADYNRFFVGGFQQGEAATFRNVSIFKTSAYVAAGGPVDMEIPDFSGLTGWNNDYALKTGVLTTWFLTASGWTGDGVTGPPFVEGRTVLSGTFLNTITP